MTLNDPNLAIVELVAQALGPLLDEMVLVGGCCVGMLITDPASPPVRTTIDVDLVAEIASMYAYYEDLSPRLRAQGFRESADADHMCRWRKGALVLDVMPSDATILGHSTNAWYSEAVRTADSRTLPSQLTIRIVNAPLFLATKLEAFYGRGNGDYAHHDMEDIINLVSGRPTLPDEVRNAPDAVRLYLRSEFSDLLEDPVFLDALPMHFRPDDVSQARVPIVFGRLRALAGL